MHMVIRALVYVKDTTCDAIIEAKTEIKDAFIGNVKVKGNLSTFWKDWVVFKKDSIILTKDEYLMELI